MASSYSGRTWLISRGLLFAFEFALRVDEFGFDTVVDVLDGS